MKFNTKKISIVPFENSKLKKKEQIALMFDNIANKYDFINHFLSFGFDFYWRKQLRKELLKFNPKKILDIATGTGDMAIELLKLNPDKIVGVDISKKMLEKAKQKTQKVQFLYADSENLPFENNSFDAITVAFGVRNFENLNKALNEAFRVLKKNGVLIILEFSKTKIFPIKQIYDFYSFYILPLVGKIIANDKYAYTYLPKSIRYFPCGKEFLNILKNIGFVNTKLINLTFGITTIYIAKK